MAESKEPNNFYLRWVHRTFSGPYGVSSLAGTVVALLVPVALKFVPDLREAADEMNDWVWIVPLVVFGALAIVRTVIAPWSIYRDERVRAEAAEARLVPRIELLPDHPAKYQLFVTADENENPLREYHRVVVQNCGTTQIEDARAFLHRINGRLLSVAPLELHPMHENDPRTRRPVKMLHEVPVAFDVIEYRHADKAFTVCGREYRPEFDLVAVQRDDTPDFILEPTEFEISVGAEEMTTLWLVGTLTGEVGEPLSFSVRLRDAPVSWARA
jgi:hypothetical protein